MAGRLDELQDRIDALRAEKLDAEVDYWVDDALADVRTTIRRIEGDRAFEHFVLDYIAKERSRLHADDSDRTDPLCTCRNRCPIKEGKLPAVVRMADSLDAGIRAYKQQHVGDPTVLLDAYEAWAELVATAETRLERIKTAMIRNEVPDSIDGDSTPADSDEDADTPKPDSVDGTGQEVPADD